jgi:phosphoribosylglycinamide formyltransferase-1
LVVLISGSGTNLQAIIDACDSGVLPVEVTTVISNERDAYGLNRARAANIPARTLDHRAFAHRADFDRELKTLIDSYKPNLLVLAGFMRVLGEEFVRHFLGRTMNIHPSLLPNYPGLNTHARALADGATEHGATVHFVTTELDGGPQIVQKQISVRPDDTPGSLAGRVHQIEHEIYPRAIGWFAEGRLFMKGNRAFLDDMPINVWQGIL